MSKVTRHESNTARFGKVITYTLRLGDVTFSAQRMVGAGKDYTVCCNIGKCGMSFNDHLAVIPGGHGVAKNFEATARALYESGEFVSAQVAHPHEAPHGWTPHATMCTDPAACGQYAQA